MHKSPPLIDTIQSPRDVIGDHGIQTLTEHYKVAKKVTGDFDIQMSKHYSADARAKIAEYYSRLRAHGFSPDGFDSIGDIRWKVVIKSQSQMNFEKSDLFSEYFGRQLADGEVEKLKQIARSMFKRIG